jgi:outer membrane receptor for ferrienterochelin and colicins
MKLRILRAFAASLLVLVALSSSSGVGRAQEPAAPPPSAASTDEDLGGLEALLGESVVTTASRSAERASSAPSTVYAITAHELRTFGIRSIDEALNFLGLGVYSASARDYSTGIDVGAQGVLLRDAGRHMLALLDGHVMNSQVYGGVSINEAFGVPLEAIDHIEVMLGAGSVMYGSNAMLLVVNVVTRRARDTRGVRVISELGLSAPHNGDNLVNDAGRYGLRYRLGASGAATFGDDAELMVSAEWLDEHSSSYGYGPFSAENHPMFDRRPGESSWGGLAHHRMLAPSGVLSGRYKNFRLLLQANHYERGIPLFGAFADPNARELQQAYRVDLRHTADLSSRLTLSSRLYADQHAFKEGTVWFTPTNCLGGAQACWFERGASARWLGLEEQATFDWFLNGQLTTTLGFDARYRRTETEPADYRKTVDGPALDDYVAPHDKQSGFLAALFLQQVWKPLPPLTLNAGARLDADTDYGARISPRAAVTVEPADGMSIRASYSEAFRGPTRYELEDRDLLYRIPPASLAPETVRVMEIELQQRLSLVSFALRGFASFYKQFIVSRSATMEEVDAAFSSGALQPQADPSYIVVSYNHENITSFGVSPSVSLRLSPALQAAASFNYAHSRMGGQPFAVMPAVFGNVRISWQPVPDGLTLAAAAIVTGNRYVTRVETPTSDKLGPQLDVKATVSGPTGIAQLHFRASVGYVHNPYLPYTTLYFSERAPNDPSRLFPVVTRLQAFVGLQYDIAP